MNIRVGNIEFIIEDSSYAERMQDMIDSILAVSSLSDLYNVDIMYSSGIWSGKSVFNTIVVKIKSRYDYGYELIFEIVPATNLFRSVYLTFFDKDNAAAAYKGGVTDRLGGMQRVMVVLEKLQDGLVEKS